MQPDFAGRRLWVIITRQQRFNSAPLLRRWCNESTLGNSTVVLLPASFQRPTIRNIAGNDREYLAIAGRTSAIFRFQTSATWRDKSPRNPSGTARTAVSSNDAAASLGIMAATPRFRTAWANCG